MKKYGLIGYPLGHSFSKTYFSGKFMAEGRNDCSYDNYPLEHIELLPELIESEAGLVGLNVTIPYKQQVMDFLDDIDPEAKLIGAVNTIKISHLAGRKYLKGYNTDVYGFEQPLLEVLDPALHTSALILGTGGASRAVAYILDKHGITYSYVSRNPANSSILSYDELSVEILRTARIIVNCSPLGMHPNVDQCPDIPYEAITREHILYDLIYNPERTLFLQKGELKKASLINGLPMLHIQAEKSWTIWNTI